MLVTIQFRIFCLPVSYLKPCRLQYIKLVPSVVSYGYETSSLKLREKHRLRMFGNGMQRRMFGPKTEELT
jgi:hypothetical protein